MWWGVLVDTQGVQNKSSLLCACDIGYAVARRAAGSDTDPLGQPVICRRPTTW